MLRNIYIVVAMILAGLFIATSCKDSATSPEVKTGFYGFIYDTDGTPFQGALVEITNGEDKVLGSQLTDSVGKFSFPEITEDLKSYKLRVSAEGYATIVRNAVEFMKDNIPQIVEIQMSKLLEDDCCNNTAKFIINDENGNPIKGARVLLRRGGNVKYEGTADSVGKILIEGICKGEYSALIKYEGYVSQEIGLNFDCLQTIEKTVVLKKAEEVCCNNIAKFVIKDESGNPIKGSRVFLRIAGVIRYEGTANDNGEVAIDGICKGEYSALIKYEGFTSQEMELNFDCGQTIEKAIVLKKAEEVCCNNNVKYVFVDENGNPIKGARVFLRKGGVVKYEGTANDNGEVVIDGICKGEYSALLKYEGYVSQEVEMTFDCGQSLVKNVTLKKSEDLCCNNIAKFTVKDESGNPIKGVRILLRLNGVTKHDPITNEDGYAAVDGICKGSYSVLIKYEGYISQELEMTFDCGQTLEKSVVMKEAEQDCCNNVAKFVIKNESGNPVNGAKVYLRKSGVVKYDGTTNDQGLLNIDGICKGSYSVLIKYEGYVSQEVEMTFDCTQTLEKSIVLKKAEVECCNNIAKFVIKDESGNPVNSAKVYLRKSGVVKYDGTTNDQGLLNIDGICKGSYSVLIKYEGYVSQEVEMTFDCAQTLEKSIVLKKSEEVCCNNNIKFVVKDENGNPLKGARVLLRKGGVVKYDGNINEDGYVVIDGICKGEYSVLVKYEGYKSQEFAVNVDCGQSLTIEKTLAKNEICCTAWAKVLPFDAESKAALNGAKVRIYKNGDLLTTLTVENGYVKFTGLCEGSYGFDITFEGYKSIEWNYEIKCNYENIFEKPMTKN